MAQKHQKRWFIWTVVFLIVAGVGLVSYIMLSGVSKNDQDAGGWIVHQGKLNTDRK